jgi:acetylglutamate kinase
VGQLLGGIFQAEVADGSKLGLVGDIRSVRAGPVDELLAAGKIPVLTSLGISACVDTNTGRGASVACV